MGLGRWCAKKKPERERQIHFLKKVRLPSSPGRQDAAPRRCGVVAPFASGMPPPLPPAPQRPCHSFGIRALLARLHPHTPRPRENGDSRRSSAAGAAHRAPTSSSCSAPQKPHSPVPQTRVRRPARTALVSRRPRAPQRPLAASCAMHCTPLVQDLPGTHAHRTCASAPTLPERTRCSHEGSDAQPAHGQVLGAQGLRRRGRKAARGVWEQKTPLHTQASVAARPPASPARDNPASLTTAAPHARPSPHRRRSHPPCFAMGCAASKPVEPTQPGPGPNQRPKAEAGAGARDAGTPAPRPPHFGPEALLASVESGAIAPLRGRWLVDWEARNGRVQRRQDLPPEAFFSAKKLRRLVEALGDDYGLLFVGLS